jgi:predicted ATPase
VQDAAYRSLLKNKRRQLHARIATVLEKQSPETAQPSPELLAHHYSSAGRKSKAIHYWEKAGEFAIRRSANSEAVGHFENALQIIKGLPKTKKRAVIELKIETSLGVVLQACEGSGSDLARQAYERAGILCHDCPESTAHFAAYWGLWRTTVALDERAVHADAMLGLAERQNDRDLKLQAHHSMWSTLIHTGNFSACRSHIEQGLALYSKEKHSELAFQFGGHDAGICGIGHDALALWMLGYPDQGSARSREAVAQAGDLSQPLSLVHALNYAAMFYYCARDLQMLRKCTDEMISLSEEQSFPEYCARGKVFRAWLTADDEQGNAKLQEIEAGLLEALSTIRGSDAPFLMSIKADVLKRNHRLQEALHILDGAMAKSKDIADDMWKPELFRVAGECLLKCPDANADKALDHLNTALNVSREQGAKSLELRASKSLAEYWRSQGKSKEAHHLLAPIYDWFTEGFETADLKEAKALLDELS